MGNVVTKRLCLPLQVFRELEAEAAAQGTTVSALMTTAAQVLLRRRQGLDAVAEFEAAHGAFSDAELAQADRLLDQVWRP